VRLLQQSSGSGFLCCNIRLCVKCTFLFTPVMLRLLSQSTILKLFEAININRDLGSEFFF
jgi:hypothetical protein